MLTCYLNKGQTERRVEGPAHSSDWGGASVTSRRRLTSSCLWRELRDSVFTAWRAFILKSFPSAGVRLSDTATITLHSWWLLCYCLAGSHSDSLPVWAPELRRLKPPARGRDLRVPNPQRGACFIELVIWSDGGCSLVTGVLMQTDVKMNTLDSGDDQ